MFSSGPNYSKLKTNLRLSINRLKLLEKKKTELALKSRKEIADYIRDGKDDRARIRVEHIVREDYMVEAMELIEMFCDLLLARFGLIQTTKEIDPGIEEAVATLIWVSPRLMADCQELKMISDQLRSKYGKEYAARCQTNELGVVNEQVMHKLSVAAPAKLLVENYMMEIAKSYKVPFEPDPTVMMEGSIPEVNDLINLGHGEIGIGYEGHNHSRGGGGGGGSAAPPTLYPNPQALPDDQCPPYEPGPVAGAPPATTAYPPPAGYNPVDTKQPFTETASGMPGMSYGAPGQGYIPPQQPSAPTQSMPQLPDLPEVPGLPSVPNSTIGTASAGGNDVDFDDLTRRFEDLKKKK